MKIFKKILFVLFHMTFAPYLSGCILATLWLWFIVPAFHVDKISIQTAIGLDLISTIFLMHMTSQSSAEETTNVLLHGAGLKEINVLANSFNRTLMVSIMVLCMGWFVHMFI